MPKRVFWPVSMVVLGAILIATKIGLLPIALWNLWPIMLIVVGLGGLLVSDKEEWAGQSKGVSRSSSKPAKKSAKKTSKAKK